MSRLALALRLSVRLLLIVGILDLAIFLVTGDAEPGLAAALALATWLAMRGLVE